MHSFQKTVACGSHHPSILLTSLLVSHAAAKGASERRAETGREGEGESRESIEGDEGRREVRGRGRRGERQTWIGDELGARYWYFWEARMRLWMKLLLWYTSIEFTSLWPCTYQ